MRDVARQLLTALESAHPVALCRLVETRGSTPQKAGATMLVFADGRQTGTLGGGCVEAEVKRRALDVLQRGVPEISKFQLDSDYGWDDGLICGGRMHVLILPIRSGDRADHFAHVAAQMDSGAGVTEAIVFDPPACGLSRPLAVAFDAHDQLIGRTWLDELPDDEPSPDPAAEDATAEDATIGVLREHLRPLADRPRPYATHGIGYLPVLPRCRLVIVGGGHVGQAVASLAADLEFDVWVADDRPDIISAERFPKAERRIAGSIPGLLPNLEITPNTYCLIVTRGHQHDEEALFHLADRGARYVGLIGSRRKIKMIFDDLLAAGISSEALARVHAPLGIDIGSRTVPEIAVSICAELVSHRNRGGVVPGRPEPISVHDEPSAV